MDPRVLKQTPELGENVPNCWTEWWLNWIHRPSYFCVYLKPPITKNRQKQNVLRPWGQYIYRTSWLVTCDHEVHIVTSVLRFLGHIWRNTSVLQCTSCLIVLYMAAIFPNWGLPLISETQMNAWTILLSASSSHLNILKDEILAAKIISAELSSGHRG